ncbi:MAG: rhomboid family intramembrane serine protease [Cytophagales bacterium]|nr:rhomboid family intramembrane serine protease [Cytophagales bacterium]
MNLTVVIIVITVVASFSAWSKPELMNKWILNPYMVWHRGQWQRMLLSGFIHKDQMHLFFNMFTFYFFGGVVEKIFAYYFGSLGVVYFLVLYLAGIVFADLPTLFKHKDNHYYNALGASGGVSALVFAFILFNPLQKICLYFVICLPGIVLGALYMIYSIYSSKYQADSINHDAHLYGAFFGILFCILVKPDVLGHFIMQISSVF